jgi:SAM-dependent methyltransferase
VSEGTHWRDIFDRIMAHPSLLSDSELYDMAMRYAQDPGAIDWSTDTVAAEPPSNYSRAYSTGAFADPLLLIVRSWEKSLSPARISLDLRRRDASTAETAPGTTAFDADWHWDHLFVDMAPFRFIAEKYAPASVLDIGCGVGAYLHLFQLLGATRILGLDGIPAGATALADDAYQMHDLAQPCEFSTKFDLVVCVEVAEHLDARHADILLDNITRHAGQVIVFSAAELGQPGHGHINCAPIEQWLEMLAVRGWYPELMDSLGMRSLATFSWFRRNLVVLRRGDPAVGAASIAALTEIGRRKFTWYNQSPGVRMFPFSEALPAEPAGYAPA